MPPPSAETDPVAAPDKREDLLKYLGPALLVTLLHTLFKDMLGLWFQVPAGVAVVLLMLWAAKDSPYLPLIQRVAIPSIGVIYCASLIATTILSNLPTIVAVTVPAALWVVTGVVIVRVFNPDTRKTGITTYLGIAEIGGGIAAFGFGTIRLLGGGHWFDGGFSASTAYAAGTALAGISLIGLGISEVLQHDRAWGIAATFCGIGMIPFSVGLIWVEPIGALGLTLIATAVAILGVGFTLNLGESVGGIALTVAGVGMTVAAAGEIVDGDIRVLSVSLIVSGANTTIAGIGLCLDRRPLLVFGLVGSTLGFLCFGIDSIFQTGVIIGIAVTGIGLATTSWVIFYLLDLRQQAGSPAIESRPGELDVETHQVGCKPANDDAEVAPSRAPRLINRVTPTRRSSSPLPLEMDDPIVVEFQTPPAGVERPD